MSICFARQCILWVCVLTCSVFSQDDPRLYTGEIAVPTFGQMGMTIGVSESDRGSFLLLTIPMQGMDNLPLTAMYTSDGSLTASIEQVGVRQVFQRRPFK